MDPIVFVRHVFQAARQIEVRVDLPAGAQRSDQIPWGPSGGNSLIIGGLILRGDAVFLDGAEHARLDHAFHLAICEASHNPVLVHTLQSLTDLMLSTVFASVNNLYHRDAQKRQIDRQHARLYNAVTGRLPEQARKAAVAHIEGICANLREIEAEEQRLVRATLRLQGWA